MGKLFIICGPSGVGKKSIIDKLLCFKELNLHLTLSNTTREKRLTEKDGIDYFFISKKEFKKKINEDEFLEYAEFFDNYYGTPKDLVIKKLNENKNVLLEIEIMGCEQVKRKMPESISIFITPPSIEILKERLRKRNSETLEKIEIRIEKALKELEFINEFDYVVENDILDKAIKKIKDIISKNI